MAMRERQLVRTDEGPADRPVACVRFRFL